MKYSTFYLVKRILLQARTYLPHIIGIFILGLLATPIALLKPFALLLIIDSGFGSQPLPGFISMFFPGDFIFTFNKIVLISGVLVILIALIDNIYKLIYWVWEAYIGEKLVLNFRTLLFNHIQRLSLAYHDKRGASDSLYRIQYDAMKIRSFLM